MRERDREPYVNSLFEQLQPSPPPKNAVKFKIGKYHFGIEEITRKLQDGYEKGSLWISRVLT